MEFCQGEGRHDKLSSQGCAGSPEKETKVEGLITVFKVTPVTVPSILNIRESLNFNTEDTEQLLN